MKLYGIALTISAVFLLGGCVDKGADPKVNEPLPSENESEEVEEVVQENSIISEKGKKLVPIGDLKERAAYTTMMQVGEKEVELFVVAIEETVETIEFSSAFGMAGDQVSTGTFGFYLAEPGSNKAVLQEQLEVIDEEIVINFQSMPFRTFQIANQTFLQFKTQYNSIHYGIQVWTMHDGELKEVQFDENFEIAVSTDQVKVIDNQYVQTYEYERNGKTGWTFNTYKWNEKDMSFTTYYESEYTAEAMKYGWETGEYLVGLWNEFELYYVSFPNLTFTKKSRELAVNGHLEGSPYPLGTSIDKILEEQPGTIEEGYYNGGTYYLFPDGFTYFYDELSRETTNVSIQGARVKNDYTKLDSIFGTPSFSGFSEYEDAYLTVYPLGDFELRINADKNNRIQGAWLKSLN